MRLMTSREVKHSPAVSFSASNERPVCARVEAARRRLPNRRSF